MKRGILILLLSIVLFSAACLENGTQTPSSSTTSQVSGTSTSQNSETWEMELVWSVSTSGIPFMDMSSDGSLSAVIDFNGNVLYLVKPTGESVSFSVEEGDNVAPVVSGVAIKGPVAYVIGTYEGFSGVRKYSWSGFLGEERHGGPGSVADNILRSPSGNHLCYLVTVTATEQELYCDGRKAVLSPNDYDIHSVSDSGTVVIARENGSTVLKDGGRLFGFESENVIAYNDRLLVSEDGKLRIYSLSGEVLAEKEGYTFKRTTLARWTLIPTEKYIFRYEPLEDTAVLTWDLSEVKTLPGFPYFANENFVVMGDENTLHCYSLEDFHEVFSLEVPDDIGYVRLSDDGKILLVSGETGNFWLYRAKGP